MSGEWSERFWVRVERGKPDECWPWIGPRDGKYGRTRPPNGKPSKAHRVAFILAGGTVPPGHDVDHICVNPICCNPDHLQAVTRAENTRLGVLRRDANRGVSVHRRRNKDGWGWQVRWREHGRSRSATFAQEIEARQYARVVYVERVMEWY